MMPGDKHDVEYFDENGSKIKTRFADVDTDFYLNKTDQEITEYFKRQLAGAADEDNDDDNAILEGADDADGGNEAGPAKAADADAPAPGGVENDVEKLRERVSQNSINVNKEDGPDGKWDVEDFRDRYSKGELPLLIDSATPRAGPTYGSTMVRIRAPKLG